MIAAILILFLSLIDAKICTTNDNCRFEVLQCLDPQWASSCSFLAANSANFVSDTVALASCRKAFGESATLATPGDDAVNDRLFSLCPTHRFFDLKRMPGGACNEWVSSDGTKQTYFKWDSFEPNNGGIPCTSIVIENCVGFKFNNRNKNWHDSQCIPTSQDFTFVANCVVCVIPTTTTTTTTRPTTPTTTRTTTPTTISTRTPTTLTTTLQTIAPAPSTEFTTATIDPELTSLDELTSSIADGTSQQQMTTMIGAIVGSVVGVCLLAILAAAFVYRRRKQRQQQSAPAAIAHSEPSTAGQIAVANAAFEGSAESQAVYMDLTKVSEPSSSGAVAAGVDSAAFMSARAEPPIANAQGDTFYSRVHGNVPNGDSMLQPATAAWLQHQQQPAFNDDSNLGFYHPIQVSHPQQSNDNNAGVGELRPAYSDANVREGYVRPSYGRVDQVLHYFPANSPMTMHYSPGDLPEPPASNSAQQQQQPSTTPTGLIESNTMGRYEAVRMVDRIKIVNRNRQNAITNAQPAQQTANAPPPKDPQSKKLMEATNLYGRPRR